MRFWVLKHDRGELFGTKWAYGEIAKPDLIGDVERCPVCATVISIRAWLPPHRVSLSSAKPEKWGDFVWGAGFYSMTSARFKEAYESEKLNGIRRFYPPAEIERIGKRKTGDLAANLPTYHLIEIERLGPELDEKGSGVLRRSLECNFCHRGYIEKWDRVIIKPDSWSGEDIFFPRGLPGTMVVSERFKEVADNYHLTNVWLIPAERWAYDEHRAEWPHHYERGD